MDKQRERLVELLSEDIDMNLAYYVADHIFADGWMRPPCNVGDIVWVKDFKKCCVIEKAEITEIVQSKYGTYIRYEYPALRGRIYARSIEYIGKTIFLTREEAEQALVNYGSSKKDIERKEDNEK